MKKHSSWIFTINSWLTRKALKSWFKHTLVMFVMSIMISWTCQLTVLVLTLSKVRRHLNLLKVVSQLTRLSMLVLLMVKISGVITMKRAWLFSNRFQLKMLSWQLHVLFFMCHLQLLMKTSNRLFWITLLLPLKNWMNFVIWMLSAMVKVLKHSLLTKSSLLLNVLVKTLNFVLVLQAWQKQITHVCQLLQNVKLFKKMLSNFHCFQQQLSVHSLKLRKCVLNVWLSVSMNCHKKITMLSLHKKSMNGLSGKKKLDLMFLSMVNLNVTTWLSTSVKTCLVTSSLKMVGCNHMVCVGLNHQSSGVMSLVLTQSLWNGLAMHKAVQTSLLRVCWLDLLLSLTGHSRVKTSLSRILLFKSPLLLRMKFLTLKQQALKSSKLMKLLFVKNCHSVVVTGMKTTLTGRFQPSVWYTQQ